MYVNCTNS